MCEDFVLQFLDRCFYFIENTKSCFHSAVDQQAPAVINHRSSNEEQGAKFVISSVCRTVLSQCSKPIFQSVLHKIEFHLINQAMEIKVSGTIAATIVAVTAMVRPNESLKVFVPSLMRSIKALTSHDDFFG
jgi:hypothetical protein